MSAPDLYKEIANRCPGIPMSDIRDAVSAIPAAFGTPPSGEATNPTTMMITGELADDASAGAANPTAATEFNYPESFRCYIDENGDYQVESPYVCLPNGTHIEATGGGSISGQGSYYCKVTKTAQEGSDPSYEAEIVTEEGSGGDDDESTKTIACVPLFDINGDGEVIQHHVGVIVVAASGSSGDPAEGSGLEINDDGELDLVDREDDGFAVHEVQGEDSGAIAKVLATDDFSVVSSLNDVMGDADIIGGEHITVETDGQTIKISYDEDKEEEDDDPNDDDDDDDKDPCGHPGDDSEDGGVNSDDDDGEPGGGGGDISGGGVNPGDDGDAHIGDNPCCGG